MLENNNQTQFHDELKELLDQYVHEVYDASVDFPKDELLGVTSQLRRSALSIVLNYIEGYARRHRKVIKNSLQISYGSLKESKYLLYFSYKRKYLGENNYQEILKKADRIGKMLWGILEKL